MAARPYWKGFLRFGLVSVPVSAVTASKSGHGEVHLNMLHSECHSRIKYKKTCPIHGEVPNDEIVTGYEYSKGQYVIVDPDDVEKIRPANERAINVESFVKPDAVDPIYLAGKTYYLLPDGPAGEKPFGLLHEAMTKLDRNAVAEVVMHGKKYVVLVRPVDKLLAMSVLEYESQVKKPAEVDGDVKQTAAKPEELKLAETLIDASTSKRFDLAQFKDDYTEKMKELIEKKVAGEEIVAPPSEEPAHVVNLMDALKQSLAKVQGAGGEEAKPPKKMVVSARKPMQRARRKKSG
jgi:DNA end-binding protein Ku